MDSYTIGRECFGMEKEFIVEVVQNCPNPACRYYKTQLELSYNKPTYIPEPPGNVCFVYVCLLIIYIFVF